MAWSINIGRVFGIRLRLHLTFLLLLGFFFIEGLTAGGLAQGLLSLLFICGVFVIVVLHELSHSLVALAHGMQVADITLLPIGGVARLGAMPEDAATEIKVSIAGPLLNFALALIGLPFLIMIGAGTFLLQLPATPLGFVMQLYVVNLIMGVFNLIPAFPMDGGRIFRAVLAIRRDYVSATQTAARVGRRIAIVMGILGIFYNPWLIVLAVFLWSAGAQEERMVRMRHSMASPFGPAVWVGPPPPAGSPDVADTAEAFDDLHRRMREMMWHLHRRGP